MFGAPFQLDEEDIQIIYATHIKVCDENYFNGY